MKYIQVLLLSLFLTSCGSPALVEDANFLLEIVYQEEESSEDSNGQGVSISIVDNRVMYSWDYWGYHPNDDFETHKSEKMNLSDEDLQSLKVLISEKNLWTPIHEDQPSNLMGDSLYVEFFASDKEQEVMSSVSGMTWTFEDREGNLKELEFVDSVDDLINFIEDRIDD